MLRLHPSSFPSDKVEIGWWVGSQCTWEQRPLRVGMAPKHPPTREGPPIASAWQKAVQEVFGVVEDGLVCDHLITHQGCGAARASWLCGPFGSGLHARPPCGSWAKYSSCTTLPSGGL